MGNFFGDGRGLSDEEQKAVMQFSGDGKSMLLVAGAGESVTQSMAGVNRISARYGILFSKDIHNSGDISVGIASRLFAGASEFLGRFLKMVHKA